LVLAVDVVVGIVALSALLGGAVLTSAPPDECPGWATGRRRNRGRPYPCVRVRTAAASAPLYPPEATLW